MTHDSTLALMIEATILTAEARHARDLRQSKKASMIEAKLRRVQNALLAVSCGQS